MEYIRKFEEKDKREQDIVFSRTIKAGKRIYYIDVKKNRKEEFFLAITESKRVRKDESDSSPFEFEKHKIFLYKEDFEKFSIGLDEALSFIRNRLSTDSIVESLGELIDEDNLVSDEEISFKIEGLE